MALSDLIRKIEESPRSTKISAGIATVAVGALAALGAYSFMNNKEDDSLPVTSQYVVSSPVVQRITPTPTPVPPTATPPPTVQKSTLQHPLQSLRQQRPLPRSKITMLLLLKPPAEHAGFWSIMLTTLDGDFMVLRQEV